MLTGEYVSQNARPNVSMDYKLYIPARALSDGSYGLIFVHDSWNEVAATVAARLMEDGTVPPCVILGVGCGFLKSTLANGTDRRMRMHHYDLFDRAYPDFIVGELIPYVEKTSGVRIAQNPDLHMVMGGSSGGISSWNFAWFRTDYFHRVYMSSPSFLSMGNGREMPALIRKVETKPIRVWTEYSENEPDDYFGSSLAAAIDAERALRFAGYDMQSRYYVGEGHCSRSCHDETLQEIFRFLWKDWETQPILATGKSSRFERLLPADSAWSLSDPKPLFANNKVQFCKAVEGSYVADGCTVFFEKDGNRKPVATLQSEISALGISCDGWRLYICGKQLPCIYAMNILPDGTLVGNFIQGYFHTYTNFAFPGAVDLFVDGNDRIFAATEMGIQAVRPFGLIDVILPMPRNEVPDAVCVWTNGTERDLVARVPSGIYQRKLHPLDPSHPQGTPFPTSYYD